jgi:hypothetical protein
MEEPSKPPPLDYHTPPPRRTDPFKIIFFVVIGIVISTIVAISVALFLMPPIGGSGH